MLPADRLQPRESGYLDIAVDVTFADLDTNYRLALRNGVLVYRNVPADESTAHATVAVLPVPIAQTGS